MIEGQRSILVRCAANSPFNVTVEAGGERAFSLDKATERDDIDVYERILFNFNKGGYYGFIY